MMDRLNWGAIATAYRQGGPAEAVQELRRQGFVIVPAEPTQEMFEAGWDVIYSAMLAAAPKGMA